MEAADRSWWILVVFGDDAMAVQFRVKITEMKTLFECYTLENCHFTKGK